jgi:hypothetical protein
MEQKQEFWVNLTFQKPKPLDSFVFELQGYQSFFAWEHRGFPFQQSGMIE